MSVIGSAAMRSAKLGWVSVYAPFRMCAVHRRACLGVRLSIQLLFGLDVGSKSFKLKVHGTLFRRSRRCMTVLVPR